MNHLILIMSILMLFLGSLSSQNLELQTVSCAGDLLVSNKGQSLHMTIGELAVEELSSTNRLSQGFHQTFNLISSTHPTHLGNFEITLFPNPTIDYINLESDLITQDYKLLIHSSDGQLVHSCSYDGQSINIDLTHLTIGQYFLNVLDSKSRNIEQIKFQKLN